MSEKKKGPGSGNFARFVDEKTTAAASSPPESPSPAPMAATYQATPLPEAKYPATYRMPARALQLVEAAKADARAEGRRVSKEDAVAAAIEQAYGHLIPHE